MPLHEARTIARGRWGLLARPIGGDARFKLSLNDELVDLDRTFVLVVNGKEIWERKTRSLEFLAEEMFKRYDPSRIFTTQVTVRVPKQ